MARICRGCLKAVMKPVRTAEEVSIARKPQLPDAPSQSRLLSFAPFGGCKCLSLFEELAVTLRPACLRTCSMSQTESPDCSN